MQDQLSPLARALAELIAQGVISPGNGNLQNAFPTARVVVPVYDSNGTTYLPPDTKAPNHNAQLARRSY